MAKKNETNAEASKRINEMFKNLPKGAGVAIENANYFGGKPNNGSKPKK